MGEDASLDDFLGGESSEQSEAAEQADDAGSADAAEPAGDAESADAAPSADGTETEPSAGDGPADRTESGTDPEAATAAEEPTGGDDVEPAATTYAWDGAGAACAACGETVERRWQQDSDLVCIECKDWDRP